MANYFLASVGEAEAFKKVNNNYVHFFSAKTLTDSAINISVTAEEVRGGIGAQLRGQFFHSSSFGLSMTDAMFKLEYIEAQVGGEIVNGGYGLTNESATLSAGGTYTLLGTPVDLLPGVGKVVWYNRPGSTDYASYTFPSTQTDSFQITIPGGQEGDEYCFHYYGSKENARTLYISSEFVPAELTVILTTRLYAGDASAPETGRPVGSVTVKIPRFQLNGTVDLALAMASAATISLEGMALAYDDSCDSAKYAEIIECVDISPYDGYTSLLADASALTAGVAPIVYAIGSRKIPMLMDNTDIEFTPALEEGNIASSAAGQSMTMSFTYTNANNQEVTITGTAQVTAG